MLGKDIENLVIVKLEEYSPYTPSEDGPLLAGGDILDEVKPIYSYVSQHLAEAANEILRVAPLHRIYPSKCKYSAVEDEYDMFIGRVFLPADYLRIHTFKMKDWRKPVHIAFKEGDFMDNRQNYRATRGSFVKPIIVESGVRENNLPVLKYNGKAEDFDISDMTDAIVEAFGPSANNEFLIETEDNHLYKASADVVTADENVINVENKSGDIVNLIDAGYKVCPDSMVQRVFVNEKREIKAYTGYLDIHISLTGEEEALNYMIDEVTLSDGVKCYVWSDEPGSSQIEYCSLEKIIPSTGDTLYARTGSTPVSSSMSSNYIKQNFTQKTVSGVDNDFPSSGKLADGGSLYANYDDDADEPSYTDIENEDNANRLFNETCVPVLNEERMYIRYFSTLGDSTIDSFLYVPIFSKEANYDEAIAELIALNCAKKVCEVFERLDSLKIIDGEMQTVLQNIMV